MAFVDLVSVVWVGNVHEFGNICFVLIFYETRPNHRFQLLSHNICEWRIPSADEIIVEGGVGTLWWTNGHRGKLKIRHWMGGYCRHDWGGLPSCVIVIVIVVIACQAVYDLLIRWPADKNPMRTIVNQATLTGLL